MLSASRAQRAVVQTLRFTGIGEVPPGTLVSLLRRAYAGLLGCGSSVWDHERVRWDDFDREAFASAAVGRSVFLSWHGAELVGFGSFDPRGAPVSARVGHHCILPVYQGRGYGRLQFEEILGRLVALDVQQVNAFTADLAFFAAARRLYETAGFAVVAQEAWKPDPTVRILHYRKTFAARVPPGR